MSGLSKSPAVAVAARHRDGLRFKKLDLHMHTPGSQCFSDKAVTPDQIVQAALAKGLAGIAVTDHNSGEWVDRVKEAAAKTDLVIFPGVEITCMGGKGGIHIIALFDTTEGTKDIESLLGELGLKPAEYGSQDTVVKRDPINVIRSIRSRGGLAVLAHANSSKGALSDMQGQQRTALIQEPGLNAAEGTDFQDKDAQQKHRRVVDLLDGTDATYQRKLAVYQASDNPSGNNDGNHGLAGIGTRCTYFKLDRLTLDGLGQCFADPDVRIRQDFEFTTFTYPKIVHMRVASGFLDGVEALFHEGLNSILGAKGAGKSLLVEFLRFALNQPPMNPDIRADYESKLRTRLGNYGFVEITFADETGKEITVKRTYNPAEDHPYADGQAYDLAQIFPILFLSQNEIIKVAENESEQIVFIDRFLDFRSYQQEITGLEAQLAQLDGQLADALRAFQDLKQQQLAVGTAVKEIEQLDASLKNPVFDQYTVVESKDRALREQTMYLKSLADQIASAQKAIRTTSPPALPPQHSEDPALKRVVDLNNQAKDALLTHLDAASTELAYLKATMDAEYAQWLPVFQAGRKGYEETVQKEGGDYRNLAQRRAKRVKELELLQQRLAATKQRSDQVKEVGATREAVLTSLRDAYARYTNERKAKCSKIETESAQRLTVRIRESSNLDEFRRRLMTLKRGSHLREAEIDQICTKVDPGTFVRAVIRFAISHEAKHLEPLSKTVDIDVDRMRTLANFLANELPYEDLLGLEYKALPQDKPEIRYNVGENTYQPLNQLSVGQKCTAMLVIALTEGITPIVIDQPEDSLDIRSIWEDMCSKIRRGKERRQFIFTTHSSSLAVASDTDKFLIMEATAAHGKVLFSGSMDHSPVSDQVLKYLEGGVETYRTKYGKYRVDVAR
jgi:PHP family Zn ribbon phosphoesterase